MSSRGGDRDRRDRDRDRDYGRARGRDRERERDRERGRDRDRGGRWERGRDDDERRGRDADRRWRDDDDRRRDDDDRRRRDEDDRRRRDDQERHDRDRRSAVDSMDMEESGSRKRRRDEDDGEGGMERKRRALHEDIDATELPKKAKVEPVSIEEVLEKQKKASEAAAKPVFLSKTEREKLALERRALEVEEQQRKREEARAARMRLMQRDESSPAGSDDYRSYGRYGDSRGDRNYDRERSRDRSRDRGGRDTRDARDPRDRHDRGERERSAKTSKTDEEVLAGRSDAEREKELAAIKQQYLGGNPVKKRATRPSEKYQYQMDWSTEDDTSKDINPVFAERVPYKPAFGKGFMAGIDYTTQVDSFKKHLHGRKKDEYEQGTALRLKRAERRMAKGRHWSEKSLEEMNQRDWRIFREDHNISAKGGNIPNPIRSWKESHLPAELLEAIREAQYEKPSAIQMQAIPIGLENRDILGIAETGSGKTAAFVLPMLVYISKRPKLTPVTEADGPYALILAPARELAIQIEKETAKFAKHMGVRTVCVVGGQPIEEQAFQLRRGCEVIIATPGRLLDCLRSQYAALNQCNYVVMDEADRMVDMGFEQQIMGILDAMPTSYWKSEDETEAERQEREAKEGQGVFRTTMLYSATMPPAVERLARKYLRRPATIGIGVQGRAVDRITQVVRFVKGDADRKNQLINVLLHGPDPPNIVFCREKKTCNQIGRLLEKEGYRCSVLHSGKSQEQRTTGLDAFRCGDADILVATDVASRGIDVKGVTHVINYDVPKTIEDYTHRIGRTGRAGATGLATTMLHADDTHIMYDLKQMLISTKNDVPSELAKNPASNVKPGTVDQKKRETVIYLK